MTKKALSYQYVNSKNENENGYASISLPFNLLQNFPLVAINFVLNYGRLDLVIFSKNPIDIFFKLQ